MESEIPQNAAWTSDFIYQTRRAKFPLLFACGVVGSLTVRIPDANAIRFSRVRLGPDFARETLRESDAAHDSVCSASVVAFRSPITPLAYAPISSASEPMKIGNGPQLVYVRTCASKSLIL